MHGAEKLAYHDRHVTVSAHHEMGSDMKVSDAMGVAVFVCSSDNRRDVVDQTLPALVKFWPTCPWPILIGLNTNEPPVMFGSAILSPPSEWRREFANQLDQIAEPYLLLILDDFLIEAPVDQRRLSDLAREVVSLGLDYLRLVPLGRSLAARVKGKAVPRLSDRIERVPSRHPFYCAMQAAIWRKSYLQRLLKDPLSIWEFERRYVPGSMHGAVIDAPPIAYHHVVERGRWLPDVIPRFNRILLPVSLGMRPQWSRMRSLYAFAERIQWSVCGYSNC